jgi:hypothetical protein
MSEQQQETPATDLNDIPAPDPALPVRMISANIAATTGTLSQTVDAIHNLLR